MRPLTLILWAVSLGAQTLIPDTTPTFQTGTRLVEVDAIVQNKNGAVKGLTKGDFTILDNGVPQTIAIFSVREIGKSLQAKPLPPGMVMNRPLAQEGEPVAATVILFDRLNTRVETQAYAREEALKYIKGASRNEQIGVYSLNSKFKVLQDFTDDHDRLIQAVTHSVPEYSLYLDQGGRQTRQDITINAFNIVAQHLAGLPGRKKLVWITENFPIDFTGQFDSLRLYPTNTGLVEKAIRALNNANIGVYPVDPRGVGPGVANRTTEAMRDLAQLTGGKASYGDNDIAAEIGQVLGDTDLTYTLGFYPSAEKLDGNFHSIVVKVNSPGAEVRSRQGYSASLPSKPLTEDQHHQFLDTWFEQPLEATDLTVRATARPIANRPGYYQVEITVDPSELQLQRKNGRRTGLLDLAIVPDVEHKMKGLDQVISINLTQASYQKAVANGITVINPIKVTSDNGKLLAKNLRLVVVDRASGKAGSVRVPIAAQ